MYEAPVTGNITVSIETATVVSEFLLVLLKMENSPLTMDQITEFSAFRDLVKAGPTKPVDETDSKVRVSAEGIVIGGGPKMMMDRSAGVRFLRQTIKGEMTVEAQAEFMVALLDAVASKGLKKNTGVNGKMCTGTFGYADPQEASDYLSGAMSTIVVSRSKTGLHQFPTYFADSPSAMLGGPKKPWSGLKG